MKRLSNQHSCQSNCSSASCAYLGGKLNIRDIKDLLIYYDSIPVDGSVLKEGHFKICTSPPTALTSPKKALNILTEGTP